MNSILITVRTGSTRLPKKALIEINGKPTIEYLIERVKQSKFADNIILCTTKLPEDDILCKLAQKNNIKYDLIIPLLTMSFILNIIEVVLKTN